MKPIELNEDILLNVTRPARYIGNEHNMVKKDWQGVDIRVCLCYPDVYDLGMSHLGLKILYHVLNTEKDVLCERSFAPWPDMEKVMMQKKIALFSLESKMPLAAFDIIGFSLQYELTYTNLLNMLDLSGIPLRSRDRLRQRYPLIIAGGPCAFNPESLADFVDIFVIGDGEEALLDIVQTYKALGDKDKEGLLKKMAKIEGVYVPSLYEVSYSQDRITGVRPRCDDIPTTIKKRTLKELAASPFPTRPVVSYIQTVHDRMTLEIMRGCPYRCRFCQASSIYRPVRIRKTDELMRLARETYRHTGYDEISLVSLSSASYPYTEELLKKLVKEFSSLGVGVSFPSLRIEEDLERLPMLISVIKKTGLTFALEAGREEMLHRLNKDIEIKSFFCALTEAYKKGWQKAKLYFMIGLPGEEGADIEAIVEVATEAALLRREVSRRPADITLSISSFIPKPHTPFQWEPMAGFGELKEKQESLKQKIFSKKYLKLKMQGVHTSIIEAIFSRGDRRLGGVLYRAWEKGARFDAWSEFFDPNLWDEAFKDAGVDMGWYLKPREYDEILPWDHISCGMSKEKLIEEHKAAMGGEKRILEGADGRNVPH